MFFFFAGDRMTGIRSGSEKEGGEEFVDRHGRLETPNHSCSHTSLSDWDCHGLFSLRFSGATSLQRSMVRGNVFFQAKVPRRRSSSTREI